MTTYKMWRSSAMASMVVVVGGMAPAHETAIDPALLMVQSGDCPIVISAPHGGSKPIPGVPPRHGKDARKFVTVRDDGTEVLAHLLADRLEKKLGRNRIWWWLTSIANVSMSTGRVTTRLNRIWPNRITTPTTKHWQQLMLLL